MYNDLNLKDLTFMVADPNQHIRAIVSGILHGFGAKKVHEVAAGDVAQREVSAREVDMLFCEMKLPVVNGFDVASAIRADINSPTRFIPIIFLTGHSRERDVLRARDCGGNMIITKPLSPNLIYDRLKWVASEPRLFVQSPTYTGPDRRFHHEGVPNGEGRRHDDGDQQAAESEET
jgi:CheY-like chemotaxis protein